MRSETERSRVLKAHIGHSANCSTGETVAVLFFGFGMPFAFFLTLLGTVILAVGRFRMVQKGLQENKLSIKYWTIPQVAFLCFSILLIMAAWEIAGKDAALLMALSSLLLLLPQAFALGIGYILIRRLKNPVVIAGAALLPPLLFICYIFVWLRIAQIPLRDALIPHSAP